MSNLRFAHAYGYMSNKDFVDTIHSTAGTKDLPKEIKSKAETGLKALNTIKNITQFAAYIPVVGTIIALFKLAILNPLFEKGFDKFGNAMSKHVNSTASKAACKTLSKKVKEFNRGLKIRSLVELTSLGFLLVATDFIFTIGAEKDEKKSEKK